MGIYRMLLYNKVPLQSLLNFPSAHDFTNVLGERKVNVTCRVGVNYTRETIAFHRKMVVRRLQGYIRNDRLKRARYFKELKSNKVSISPFGFAKYVRDFELFWLERSYLNQTWITLYLPPIYVPNQTYSFNWDATT